MRWNCRWAIVIFQQKESLYRFLQYISGSVYINIVSQPSGTEIYICTTIYALTKLLDSWVNTALLLVFPSGLTGLEKSWALLTIAAWLSLLPSSAWLKLYLRVFGQANPILRSYLIDWPGCSLLGQSKLRFLLTRLRESDSLDGVNWILAHPIGAEYCPSCLRSRISRGTPYLPKDAVSYLDDFPRS